MLAIVLIFGLIALIDMVPLIRRKDWKDVAALGIVFALALTVSILNQLKVPIPSTVLSADTFMRQIGVNY